MTILNDYDIDLVCNQILNDCKLRYPHYYPHIYTLYMCGCRIGELFNDRTKLSANHNEIYIITQKKNYTRIVEVNTDFKKQVFQDLELRQDLFYLNIRNLQRAIKNLMPYRNIRCGDKNIGAHIFRHNYIRKLFAQGKTIEEIDEHMGYTTQTVADTYLSSYIYY